MADEERQPFADEVKDDAHFDVASFNPTAGELQDKAHFDPASFESQQAPPAPGGGAEVPFWMQGHQAQADTSQFTDKTVPKDLGKKDDEGSGWQKALEGATAKTYTQNDDLMRQKTGEERAGMKDIKADMEKMRQRKPLELEKNQPKPEKADFSKNTMEYMQIAALMGALAGGFSRRGTTTALTAFSGMMKGLHDGNMEVFKQRSEEWKEAEQQVNDVNQAKIDEYNAVWKDDKASIDQKMQMMQLVASKYDDQITYNTAKLRDFTKLAEFQQKERDSHDARVEKSEKTAWDIEKIKSGLQAQEDQRSANYDDAAERFVKGDKGARAQAIGRGGAAASTAWNAAVQRAMQRNNLSNEDVMSNAIAFDSRRVEASTIARRGGQIAVAADEVSRLLPQLQALSAASPGSGNAIWNAAANRWDVVKGDKNYQKMVAVMNGMLTSYGSVLARGGQATDATRAKAHETLNPNMPQAARQGAFEGIALDINAARQAVLDAKEEVRTGKFSPVEVAPEKPTKAAPASGGKLKYDPSTGTLINAD